VLPHVAVAAALAYARKHQAVIAESIAAKSHKPRDEPPALQEAVCMALVARLTYRVALR